MNQVQNYAMQSAYAAAALQAAQWAPSVNPSFHSSQALLPPPPPPPSLPPTAKVKSIWPPCFETNGGSYSFQTNTGCFFENSTNFYYCPKSKLYYSGLDGSYYKYSSVYNPPFIPFVPSLPSDEPNATEEANTVNSSNDSTNRKPITLSLGGIAKPKAAKIINAATLIDDSEAIIVNTAPLQHLPGSRKSNFSEPRKREEVTPSAITNINKLVTPSVPTPTAGGGGFPCLLCKRQFPSPEMLQRHEKESKLHAENLLKKNSTDTNSTSNAPVYKDRAAERRAT
jgi:hypothetical protein